MLHELRYTCGAYRYCEYGTDESLQTIVSVFGTPCRPKTLHIACPVCDDTDMAEDRKKDLESDEYGLFPKSHVQARKRAGGVQRSPYLYPPQDGNGRLLS